MTVVDLSPGFTQNGIAPRLPGVVGVHAPLDREVCGKQPDDGGNRGEHQRFHEQLRDDAPAAGAEREAHGDLRVARRRPRVDQRADVRARHGEHEQDRQVRDRELEPGPVAG